MIYGQGSSVEFQTKIGTDFPGGIIVLITLQSAYDPPSLEIRIQPRDKSEPTSIPPPQGMRKGNGDHLHKWRESTQGQWYEIQVNSCDFMWICTKLMKGKLETKKHAE